MSRLPDFILKTFREVFPELWPFENFGILNLSARYHENCLSYGLETWSADLG